MDCNRIDRIWFLTWTTYGTWLPGDERGFVSPKFEGDAPERRNNEPGRPYDEGRADLRRMADNRLAGDPVRLNRAQAEVVRHQFEETARCRGWQLLAGAIMANHVHLVVGVPGDPDPSALLRDFKSYASRALNVNLNLNPRDRVSKNQNRGGGPSKVRSGRSRIGTIWRQYCGTSASRSTHWRFGTWRAGTTRRAGGVSPLSHTA